MPAPSLPTNQEIEPTSGSLRGFLLAAYKAIANNARSIRLTKTVFLSYLLLAVFLPPTIIMAAFFMYPKETTRFFNFQIQSPAVSQNTNTQVLGESTSNANGNVFSGYIAAAFKPQAEASVQVLRVVRPEAVSGVVLPAEQGGAPQVAPSTTTLQGPAGPAGQPGTPGQVGEVGQPGTPGLAGVAGPQGSAGINGADGVKGETGPAGTQGLAGINGTNGIDGATGPSGPQGLVGPSGAGGINGTTGSTGPQGLAGPTGATGSIGTLTTGTGLSGSITNGNLTLNLNTTVPTSVVNDTNVTGSVAANTLTLGWSGSLAASRGGTGLSTTPTNGQLLIGNGTGYTLAGLTAGSNISISNGSGSITVNTSQTPTFTSINGLTITNNGSNTLTIAAGKTLTANNSLTFSGTDGTSFTFPGSSDTVVGRSSADTLTNKTIAASSNTISGLINSNFSGSAGITNANLANSSMTINSGTGLSGGATVSLGGSVTLTNSGVTSLTGTTNQVSVSSSTGGITISIPQNIHVGASPTFSGLTLSSLGTGVLHSNSSGVLSASSVSLTADTSGTLPIAKGGTNITTYTLGDMLYASATNILSKLGIGSNGQILTVTGGLPAWGNVSSGTTPFSNLSAASASNTIDNTNFAQTWNWSSATTGNTLTLSANALTTGTELLVTSSNNSLNSTNGLVTISNTGTSTNGTIFKVQASSATANALVINTNGNSGFGIAPVGTSRLAMNGLAAAANGNVPLCIPSGGSGAIFRGGSASSCNTSSIRYKHNIIPVDENLGLKTVLALNPVTFEFNSNNQPTIGFIAEQVLTVDPRIVTLDENGLPNAIDSDQILPLLTKSIQQLYTGLTDLHAPKTNAEGTQTFVGKFFDRLIAWFADTTNGIADLFAHRVHTKTLCVGEKDNETCITKLQLDKLLSSENTTSVNITPTPVNITPTPTISPQITPLVTPSEQLSTSSASSL